MMSPANTFRASRRAAPSLRLDRAGQVLPVRDAELPARRRRRRLPGRRRRRVRAEQGVKNIYILNDKEAYGLGVATNFRDAAESLGIKIAGFEAWDPKATSYTSLFDKIKATGADAVFLGGLIDENGAQLIKDKVAVLGPNDGAVKLFAPDGFATQATIDESGAASAGMFLSVAGQPIDAFTGQGQGVRRRAPGRPALGQGHRPVRDLRRPGGAGPPRRDRRIRRLAVGRHLEAVRVRRAGRPARLVHVQRERRSVGRGGCGRRPSRSTRRPTRSRRRRPSRPRLTTVNGRTAA